MVMDTERRKQSEGYRDERQTRLSSVTSSCFLGLSLQKFKYFYIVIEQK